MLLLGLMFSLLAITILIVRIGDANILRSKAQTAADAAALAAVNDTQDRMASALANGGIIHYPSWNEESGESAAESYAKDNNAVVTDIRASDNAQGFSGDHVRVEVRGAECQRELEEDRSREAADAICDGTEEEKEIDTFSGEAAAIARIDMPDCHLEEVRKDVFFPMCAGVIIYNEDDARSVIDVQLVDEEGEFLYEPGGNVDGDFSNLAGGAMGPCDAPNANNVTPLMCETHKAILKEFPSFGRPQWSGCYRPDGGYVVGEHPKGRACDYMTNLRGGYSRGEEKQIGDAVAEFATQNAKELGIMYIIWEQKIWKPSEPRWSQMEDRGDPNQNHYNHVHISVN